MDKLDLQKNNSKLKYAFRIAKALKLRMSNKRCRQEVDFVNFLECSFLSKIFIAINTN